MVLVAAEAVAGVVEPVAAEAVAVAVHFNFDFVLAATWQ